MMIKQIPNLITLLNLVCGLLSIWMSFRGEAEMAAYLIFGGAFLDFFDGATARLLKVSGEMGKQLDSLADLITFGLAPAAIALHLMERYGVNANLYALTMLIPIFSAVRLANFNIDDRQSSEFIGLPTPANGFFWAGILFISLHHYHPEILLPTLVVFQSLMLVSGLSMFSLKFKSLSWKGNELRFSFMLLSLILIGILYLKSIPIIVFLYIIISIIKQIFFKTK